MIGKSRPPQSRVTDVGFMVLRAVPIVKADTYILDNVAEVFNIASKCPILAYRTAKIDCEAKTVDLV